MNKDDKKFVKSTTFRILSQVFEDGRDAENICDDILDDVIDDIEETADPENWHDGDIRIAIARVLKQRLGME